MNKVLVMACSDQALVPKDVRSTSLRYMNIRADHALTESDGDEDVTRDVYTVAGSRPDTEHYEATEVVRLPHDLPSLLVKEIVWESGFDLVTLVLYGTPAAGSGVLACLEMGCTVVSL